MATADDRPVPGDRVTYPAYSCFGTLIRYERAYRTDWTVVHWDGQQFTQRYLPSQIVKVS